MPDETHNLQKDPPEGSRKVVEQELERNFGKDAGKDRPGEGAPGKNGDKEDGAGN